MGRNITAEHIQRILINPFYAIQVSPQFVASHDPSIGDEEWVKQERVAHARERR